MRDAIPTPIQDARYLVLGRLGRGGTATVFRAFDRVAQRVVALKSFEGTRLAGPSHPLATEFEVWSRLGHPNIVCAYDLRVARHGPLVPGTPYLVLEHVGGGPVHAALVPGRIPMEVLEQLAVQTLQGLGHVHDHGLVHRDLKPGNLLVDTSSGEPRIKLTDFGLAEDRGKDRTPGCVSGSLPYLAPEALLGRPLDGRADLYGLGIVLYQLATGEMPVCGGSLDTLMRWHLGGPPADPRRIRPRFPERLARFVRRLTEREPGRRPACAAEALGLLGAPRRATTRVTPPRERGLRARVRLALDAARLGARRTFYLPGIAPTTEAAERQVRVWAKCHGLGYHRLVGDANAIGPALCRMVLDLLLERDGDASALLHRFCLDHVLPLTVVGCCPVWDLSRPLPEGTRRIRRAAHTLARFLLHCSTERTLILRFSLARCTDPLPHALLDRLERETFQPARPVAGRGGLLLLLDGRRRAAVGAQGLAHA